MKSLMTHRFFSRSAAILLVGFGLLGAAHADDACKTTKFSTQLIKDACAKGGQKEAKEVMKKFTKEARAKKPSIDCKSCHAKIGGSFDLKPDGLAQYRELGGQ